MNEIFCRQNEIFKSCVRSDLNSCTALYKASLQGTQDAYDKMCGEYRSGRADQEKWSTLQKIVL